MGDHVGAQAIADLAVTAFGNQMQVEVTQQHAKRIRILGDLHRVRPLDAQMVARATLRQYRRHAAREEAIANVQQRNGFTALGGHHVGAFGAREEDAHDRLAVHLMRAQHRERVAMPRHLQRIDITGKMVGLACELIGRHGWPRKKSG